MAGADPLSDLAVLRAEGGGLPAAVLGDADPLAVRRLVVAIGNPPGPAGSVTAGVVSALGRALPVGRGRARRVVEDVTRTDAALNPGNPGGALVDGHARVAGIDTSVAGVGLGLPVPVNAATQEIIAALMREGRVRRAYVGIAGGPRPLPPRVRAALGRTAGAPVADVGDLQRLVGADAIGREVTLELRDGRPRAVALVPEELRQAARYRAPPRGGQTPESPIGKVRPTEG